MKDEAAEARLKALHALLAPLEEALLLKYEKPANPLIFIVGPPCSGTTLTAQVIGTQSAFSGISNLHARFWNTPATGAKICRALGVKAGEPKQFESVNGVTKDWDGIHEFGYFWNHYFDLGQETHHLNEAERSAINSSKLKQAVAAMEGELGGHLFFKNNTWCTFQADWLAKVFPSAYFIVCERDLRFVAQSIYLTRKKRYGHHTSWWSVKPSAYASILAYSPLEQVAMQAGDIRSEMEAGLKKIESRRIYRSNYEVLCRDPRGWLKTLYQKINLVEEVNLVDVPECFPNRNVVKIDDISFDQISATLRATQNEDILTSL